MARTSLASAGREFLKLVRYRALYDYGLGFLYDAFLRAKATVFGAKIMLDAASACQLKCPACPTASGENRAGVIGWGVLKFDDFRDLVDRNPRVRLIELSNWGEMFLNPELPRILEYAHRKGVRLTARNGVNLNNAKEEILEQIVRYKFREMVVSIDGASPEIYRIYRQRGNFETVIENIRTINRLKKLHNSPYPKLYWQFVIFGHNEHEIPAARAMAEELGMAWRPKLNYSPTYSPVKDPEWVKRESGLEAATRVEFKTRRKRDYMRPCTQLWDSPQINWDGSLLGCCVNNFGAFGNVFEKGLEGALRGERYRYAKAMVQGRKPPREDIPCYSCQVYWDHRPGGRREVPERIAAPAPANELAPAPTSPTASTPARPSAPHAPPARRGAPEPR
jgi:MoaA/NifB/PqqE/SkfB family radical SAM enzyme